MIETQPFKWRYESGLLEGSDGSEWAYSYCVFCNGDREYTHAGLLNVKTSEFRSHADWGNTSPWVIVVPVGGGEPVYDHGTQVAPFRESHYRTSPRVLVTGRLVVDDIDIKVRGESWVDWEEGRLQQGIPWKWISFRYDNFSSRLVYEIGGETWVWDKTADGVESKLQKFPLRIEKDPDGALRWGDSRIIPAAPNQVIHDPNITGAHYTEAFCWVECGGKRIGYAFYEEMAPGWGREPLPTEDEARLVWAHGNESAAEFLKLIQRASLIADHFVDDDPPFAGKAADMVELITLLLLLIPENKFYQDNKATLQPVITSVLLTWECSNHWADSEKKDVRVIGYAWRESMLQIISMVGLLTGGRAGGREALLAAVDLYHGPNGVESFEYWDTQNASKRRE